MMQIKRSGRVWQMATLAMVALPWFFRDQLAISLEESSREVQQALIEANAQQQQEQQGDDLRQLNQQLARIELRQRQSTGELGEQQVREETAQLLSGTFAAEGKALEHRVKSFEKLLPKIDMEATTRKSLSDKAHAAGEAAHALATFDVKAQHEHLDRLVEQWDHAETQLREAYEQLVVEAENDREASATLATWARFVAWAFTALAAFMVGGWKRILPGNDEGGEKETP